MEKLLALLQAMQPVSLELQQYLALILTPKEIKKKALLLKQGQVCRNIYFVENGLLRCFYNKKDKEISCWFMQTNNFVISVESFFRQKPSYENIQALEDSLLWSISYEELQKIYTLFPEFNAIGRVITEQYYTLSEQRLYSLRMQKAPDKYRYLLNHFPEIIQKVPSKYIASYLSITEGTLSRIKGRK